jgi:hypothetical protein
MPVVPACSAPTSITGLHSIRPPFASPHPNCPCSCVLCHCKQAAIEATEIAHATTHRSTLPLGKGGINLLESKAWVSDYDRNFHPHKIDIAGDLARAAVSDVGV